MLARHTLRKPVLVIWLLQSLTPTTSRLTPCGRRKLGDDHARPKATAQWEKAALLLSDAFAAAGRAPPLEAGRRWTLEAQQQWSEAHQRWNRILEQQVAQISPLSSWMVSEVGSRLSELGEVREGWLARLRRMAESRFAWNKAHSLMRSNAVEDLSGTWRIQERHNMDNFLRELGFNAFQRAAVLKAGQVQVIRRNGEHIQVITRDVRGTSELRLPIGGKPVLGAGDGESEVARAAFVEGDSLVFTESARDGQLVSVCKRSLNEDGRMIVDVRKRTPGGSMVSMRVIYTPVNHGFSRSEAATEEEAPDPGGGM